LISKKKKGCIGISFLEESYASAFVKMIRWLRRSQAKKPEIAPLHLSHPLGSPPKQELMISVPSRNGGRPLFQLAGNTWRCYYQ
jgi:hypothetical protein